MPIRTRLIDFRHLACAGLVLAAFELASIPAAQACACCSDRGSRVDASAMLDDATRWQIGRMKFAQEAVLGGDMNDEPSGLPSGMSSTYDLTVTREDAVMTFAFRPPTGMNGTLRFTIPKRYHVFAVDPFGDAKDDGLGPPLYKEWRLTAAVKGDGVFSRATPKGKQVTLIFHGSGRGCTEAEHFTHWSLLLHGPAGKVTFYGALEKP